MFRSLLVFFVLGTFLTGSCAVTVEIIEPITEEGDEVALIFIPHIFGGEQYRKTAQAIQAASGLRVWVALTKDYFMGVPDIQQVPEAVQMAMEELLRAGMTSKKYIGVGHGLAGHVLQSYAPKSQLKAIVLMGSSIPLDTKLQDFKLPVLTLAAELDGITRITRIAEEYGKLQEEMLQNFLTLYRAPIIILEGANHAQFASGNVPFRVKNGDLTAEAPEEDVHGMIGRRVNSFLTATFSSSPAAVEIALEELERAFFKSIEKFQPLLDLRALDVSGTISPWTILAQEHIAGQYANQIEIYNSNTNKAEFAISEPSIETLGDSVIVHTTSHVHYKEKGYSIVPVKASPIEVRMKLKSKDAIWHALTADNEDEGPLVSLRAEPETCRSLNKLALRLALNHSSAEALDRYNARGKPLIFERDFVRDSRFLFSHSSQRVEEDSSGVRVRAIVYHTDITDAVDPGMMYCTVMSPYSVMEWLYIDSLRE